MCSVSKLLPVTIFALSAGFALANTESYGQEHLIGENQTVSRVIKLRSSNPTPKRSLAPTQATSRSVRAQTPKSSAVTNPSLIRFDDFHPADPVPRALESVKQNVAPQIQQQANFPRVAIAENFPHVDKSSSQKPKPVRALDQVERSSQTLAKANSPSNQLPADVSVSKRGARINTEIEAPGYINLRQSATIRIKLHNVGEDEASNVKLVATLPTHATFKSASPEPARSEGQVHEFVLPLLGADEVQNVDIELVPTVKAPLEIGTEVVIENTQTIAVGVREPKLTLKIQGPAKTHIGQQVTHKVVIENSGDGIAEGIVLQFDHADALKPAKDYGMINVLEILPGRSVIIDYQSTAKAPGQTQLQATVTAKGIEAQTADSDVTIYQPELEVAATGPKMNFLNREGIYTIKLNNTGEVDVSNVELKLHVSSGMQVTTISREAEVDVEKGVLVWSFVRIPAKTEQVVQLKTLATAEGQQDCQISVVSNETRDKEMKLATVVASRADLNVSIEGQSGPVQVGDPAEFLVTVENKGSSDANDVAVSIELPDSLKPLQRNGVSIREPSNGLTFQGTKIQPGQKQEFLFSVVGTSQGEHIVRSVLQTRGSERKIIVEGSVYVYDVSEASVSESLSPVISR